MAQLVACHTAPQDKKSGSLDAPPVERDPWRLLAPTSSFVRTLHEHAPLRLAALARGELPEEAEGALMVLR